MTANPRHARNQKRTSTPTQELLSSARGRASVISNHYRTERRDRLTRFEPLRPRYIGMDVSCVRLLRVGVGGGAHRPGLLRCGWGLRRRPQGGP